MCTIADWKIRKMFFLQKMVKIHEECIQFTCTQCQKQYPVDIAVTNKNPSFKIAIKVSDMHVKVSYRSLFILDYLN